MDLIFSSNFKSFQNFSSIHKPSKVISILCMIGFFFFSEFNSYAQQAESQKVQFSISQGATEVYGSVDIIWQFVFFGNPYLKLTYNNLVVESIRYKGMLYRGDSNFKKYISFPYTVKDKTNPITISANIFIPENYGSFLSVNRQVGASTTYQGPVYGFSDSYDMEKVISKLKMASSDKFSESDVWEKSEIDEFRIQVLSLSSNITYEITNKLDAGISDQKKAEAEKKAKEEKEAAAKKAEEAKAAANTSETASGSSGSQKSDDEVSNSEENYNHDSEADEEGDNGDTYDDSEENTTSENSSDTIHFSYTREQRQAFIQKQREAQLKKSVENTTNAVIGVANKIMADNQKKMLEEQTQKLQAYRSAEKNYHNRIGYFGEHWNTISQLAKSESLTFNNALKSSHGIFYGLVLTKSVTGKQNMMAMQMDQADYSQLKYRIYNSRIFPIDIRNLTDVPDNKKEEVVTKAIKEQLIGDQKNYIIGFADNADTLQNYLTEAQQLDSQVQFTTSDGTFNNQFDAGQFSSRNLLEQRSLTSMIKDNSIASGTKVCYMENGNVLIINGSRYIMFSNLNYFKSYSKTNVNSQINTYNNWVKEMYKYSALFPEAVVDNQLYLPNMGYVSDTHAELLNGEMVDVNKYQLPKLYYPANGNLDHILVLSKQGQNTELPTFIKYDFHSFNQYTNSSQDKIYRPIMMMGKYLGNHESATGIQSSHGFSDNVLTKEDIVEMYPALWLKKISKTGNENGSLNFTYEKYKSFNSWVNEYNDYEWYFGNKIKYTNEKIGDRYVFKTKNIQFTRYKIVESMPVIIVEYRNYSQNGGSAYDLFNQFNQNVNDNVDQNEISQSYGEQLKKDYRMIYSDHYNTKDLITYNSITAVQEKPFYVMFNGQELNLTSQNASFEGGLTAFDFLYQSIKKDIPKDDISAIATETMPVDILDKKNKKSDLVNRSTMASGFDKINKYDITEVYPKRNQDEVAAEKKSDAEAFLKNKPEPESNMTMDETIAFLKENIHYFNKKTEPLTKNNSSLIEGLHEDFHDSYSLDSLEITGNNLNAFTYTHFINDKNEVTKIWYKTTIPLNLIKKIDLEMFGNKVFTIAPYYHWLDISMNAPWLRYLETNDEFLKESNIFSNDEINKVKLVESPLSVDYDGSDGKSMAIIKALKHLAYLNIQNNANSLSKK